MPICRVPLVLIILAATAAPARAADATGSLPLWSCVPFVGILLSIALFPLLKPAFWHHHFGKIALFWSLLFLVPFAIARGFGHAVDEVLHVYVLEFIPFIILLWSLYTVAGGIRIKGSLRGTPKVNATIILIGTLLASWMGTTGAAMLLIRPLIKANAWRKHRVHTVVFFIFLVANVGGSLTPLGDPPLFLGFLQGVDFFWTAEHLLVKTGFTVAVLLGAFIVVDTILLKREDLSEAPSEDGGGERLGIEGGLNFVFLIGIVLAILLSGSFNREAAFYDHGAIENAEAEMKQAGARVERVKLTLAGTQDTSSAETRDAEPFVHALLEGTQAEATAAHETLQRMGPDARPSLVLAQFRAQGEVNRLRSEAEHHATKGLHLTEQVTWPWINLLRDGFLVLMGLMSLWMTSREIRRRNDFNWFPIVEVAKLFAGIFITIIPAITILRQGVDGALADIIMAVTSETGTPLNSMYFWFTGILSSFLDNAPTYLVFFNTAGGNADVLMNEGADTLIAISAGAVFMGAVTYIGNAPNFMVRSIAEEAGIKMPSFFGYLGKWAIPFLIPTFVLVTIIFLA